MTPISAELAALLRSMGIASMARVTNCEDTRRANTSLATRSQPNWNIAWSCRSGLAWSYSAGSVASYLAGINRCNFWRAAASCLPEAEDCVSSGARSITSIFERTSPRVGTATPSAWALARRFDATGCYGGAGGLFLKGGAAGFIGCPQVIPDCCFLYIFESWKNHAGKTGACNHHRRMEFAAPNPTSTASRTRWIVRRSVECTFGFTGDIASS